MEQRLNVTWEKDGKQVPVQGLFSNYLRDKSANYVPPTRTGTPRGESVGMSAMKYNATLMALTSLDVKKQAANLQVSYGLLRKWRTERPFVKQVNAHAREFMDLFFERVRQRVVQQYAESDAFLKLPIEDIATAQILGRSSYSEFNDGKIYAVWLLEDLYKAHVKRKKPLRDGRDLQEADFQAEALWIIDYISGLRGEPTPFMDVFRSHKIESTRAIIVKCIGLLTWGKLSEDDRRNVVYMLRCVDQALEREIQSKKTE